MQTCSVVYDMNARKNVLDVNVACVLLTINTSICVCYHMSDVLSSTHCAEV